MTMIHTSSISRDFTSEEIAASSRVAKRAASSHMTSASFGGGGGRIRFSDGTIEGVSFSRKMPAVAHISVSGPTGFRALSERTEGFRELDHATVGSRAFVKRSARRSTRRLLKIELLRELNEA